MLDEGEIDLVDDLDEDLVGCGGDPAHDELVAEQHDGRSGDPWMQRFGSGFTACDCAPQDKQPIGGKGVRGLLRQLGQELRGSSGCGNQLAQNPAKWGAPVAVRPAEQLQGVVAQRAGVGERDGPGQLPIGRDA